MPFLKKRIGAESGGFGETLHELRELRGLTLQELGVRSGIHPQLLRALEEERLEDLADPIYAERHVATIATALEGRPGYLLEKYRDLLVSRGLTSSHDLFPRPRVSSKDLFVGPRAVAFVGFLLFVLLVAAYVFWQARIVSSVPRLTVVAPAEGASFTEPRLRVAGITDPTAVISVNGLPAVVDERGQFTVVVDIPRGLSTIQIDARRRYGSSVQIERHVTYLPPVATSTSP